MSVVKMQMESRTIQVPVSGTIELSASEGRFLRGLIEDRISSMEETGGLQWDTLWRLATILKDFGAPEPLDAKLFSENLLFQKNVIFGEPT